MSRSVNDVVADFFAESDTKTYVKDTILTMPGEDLRHVTYLVKGMIEQYDITPEGNKIVVNIFKPGAFFPMSWAMNDTPNSYFFAAMSNVAVKHVQPDAAVQFLKDNPDVTFDLLSRVYRGTDAVLRRLVLASSGTASARLIFELIIEAYRFGTNEGDDGVSITVKQSSLAARSGLARETVSRELYKLEQGGLVVRSKQGILVYIDKLEEKLNVAI